MQLTFDGTHFDVLDGGKGSALVLLHGFPLAKEIWDAQAEALARTVRVIRFDLRGLGRSSAAPGPYLMESLAGDVADVLDALGVGRAVVAGHSLGGYVAFAFYRMFTERCRALGLICTRAAADDEPLAAARLELAARIETEGIAPLADWYVPRLLAPDAYRTEPALVARVRGIVERTDPAGGAAMLRGMAARVSNDDLLDEIDLPVSVIAGADDRLGEPAAARTLAATIRGAEFELLQCGHLPSLEKPEALTAALARLIARAAPA
jgi:pimeloyl-ACP methyl ester carboxylesterase